MDIKRLDSGKGTLVARVVDRGMRMPLRRDKTHGMVTLFGCYTRETGLLSANGILRYPEVGTMCTSPNCMILFPGTSNFVHGAPFPQQGKDLPAWVTWLAIVICEDLVLTRIDLSECQARRGCRTVGEDGR